MRSRPDRLSASVSVYRSGGLPARHFASKVVSARLHSLTDEDQLAIVLPSSDPDGLHLLSAESEASASAKKVLVPRAELVSANREDERVPIWSPGTTSGYCGALRPAS